MNSYIHVTIAMISVINPIVCGTMLLQITNGINKKEKIQTTLKAMAVILAILLLSAIGGHYILSAFGISMDAFKIVGGIILAFIGFQMLNIQNRDTNTSESIDFSKLILFAASPGTIAMVITLAAAHESDGLPIVVLVGILLAMSITLAVVISILFLSKQKKASGPNMVSKFMGLIIVAMGLQFMLDGIKLFFFN